MKQTISVVVSAYNEEKTLDRCLSSVAFADEIIVVDNSSVDSTASVAKAYTKKIYKRPNILMLNTNKNYGFNKATGQWILNLDADEEITLELAKEIQTVVNSDPPEFGFWIKRKNISFGKWIKHGLWWPDKQIRLFRRTYGKFPCVHIHEYITVDGTVGVLTEPYLHYNYETVRQYLTKINRASTSEAIVLRDMHYKISWHDAIRFPVSDFLKIYFAQSGYKDGLHGLVLALFQAFYSFCTFAKLWEIDKYPHEEIVPDAIAQEFCKNEKEIRYWKLTMLIHDSSSAAGRFIRKIQRRLNIA